MFPGSPRAWMKTKKKGLTTFPYCKWWKAEQGLGTRLKCLHVWVYVGGVNCNREMVTMVTESPTNQVVWTTTLCLEGCHWASHNCTLVITFLFACLWLLPWRWFPWWQSPTNQVAFPGGCYCSQCRQRQMVLPFRTLQTVHTTHTLKDKTLALYSRPSSRDKLCTVKKQGEMRG